MYNILLGATTNNDLIFANIENDRNFSVSFAVVHPFKTNDDLLLERAEQFIEEMDRGTLYDWCCEYDCAPSELPDHIAEYEGIEFLFDCSCYDDIIEVDGDDWYFESVACGQCDPRDYTMKLYACDDKVFNVLMTMWDEMHLGEPINPLWFELLKACFLDSVGAENWIQNFLRYYVVGKSSSKS